MSATERESPVEEVEANPVTVHRDLRRAWFSTDPARFRQSKEWHEEDEAWAVAAEVWTFGVEYVDGVGGEGERSRGSCGS
jgi:hypothetical protein